MKYTNIEIILTWNDVNKLIKKISIELKSKLFDANDDYEIIAIANGGIIPATMISNMIGIKQINLFPIVEKKIVLKKIPRLDFRKKYLLIDEIYDTGKTINLVKKYLRNLDCKEIFLLKRYKTLRSKDHIYGMVLNDPRWVVFPWEK